MKRFFQHFANLKLAVYLLFCIAFFSGLGSVIEQDKSLDFYQITYKKLLFGKPLWVYFKILNFDQIYSAWWFFFLITIFGICLLSCTFLQQFPAIKFARRYYFHAYSRQFNKLNTKFTGEKINKSQLCFRLIDQQYSVFQKKKSFYGYKGLIGKIGPVIVHFSIIFILIGSILSAIKGFTAQEFVPKTEVFHTQNIIKAGIFAKVPQQTFRINDFWVNYTQIGIIKQFQSDVSVLTGNGDEIFRKTISVNNPMVYNDLTLYQTDWGITGLRIKTESTRRLIQLPISRISKSQQNLWITWLPINIEKNTGSILILNNARGNLEIYDQNSQILAKISIGESYKMPNLSSVKILEFISSTGIQIKTDPGIQIIYLGFGFLMLSSLISYISFSEFWALEVENRCFIGGQTNRDKVKNQLELSKLKQEFSLKN